MVKANSWEMSYNFFGVQVHISRVECGEEKITAIGLKLDFMILQS